MGRAQQLPHRVNIVYDGRFALAKREPGTCSAQLTSTDLGLLVPFARSSEAHKWYVYMDHESVEDKQGRPLLGILRHDAHPQRSLRVGTPLMVDNASWTASNFWLIEYDDCCSRAGAVTASFSFCSLADRRYLAVDEASGQLCLQTKRPAGLWDFYDAAGTSDIAQAVVCRALPIADSAHFLQTFEGSLDEALRQAEPGTASMGFRPASCFATEGVPLGEEVVVAGPPATPAGICRFLFGPEGTLRQRLAAVASDDAQFEAFRQVGGAPWCAASSASYRIAVPVLGRRPFQEAMRLALCIDGNQAKMAVHSSSRLSMPAGFTMNSETMHVFTKESKGPVRLSGFCVVPPGHWRDRTLTEMRSKFLEYAKLVQDVLAEAPPDSLHFNPEPAQPLAAAQESSCGPVPGSAPLARFHRAGLLSCCMRRAVQESSPPLMQDEMSRKND